VDRPGEARPRNKHKASAWCCERWEWSAGGERGATPSENTARRGRANGLLFGVTAGDNEPRSSSRFGHRPDLAWRGLGPISTLINSVAIKKATLWHGYRHNFICLHK
jgi:hypothetical protein